MLIWVGSWMGAWAAAHLGDHEAAAKGMARAHALLEQFGGRLFIADWFAAADAGRVLLAGRPAEAIALAEKAIQWAKAVESLHAEALARRVLGQALAALDPPRLDEAEPHLAESARLFSASEAVIDRARTDIEWGIVCRARGDHDQARAHFERAAAQLRESDLAFPDHAAAELNRCHAGA
jgi:tetratricopeptide (TPR) repeat protein